MSNTWKVLPKDGLEDSERCVRTTSGERTGKTVFNLLSFLAAVLLLAIAVSTTQASAQAAETSVDLQVGEQIPYAGYSTSWMYIDGRSAYCAVPSRQTPAAGTYAASALSAIDNRNDEVTADLWFSFGSPGFDASLWPSTWYDGGAMTDARYAALAHVLISDSYASDGRAALHGCSAAFRNWARQYVIGFDEDGNLINPDATGRRILDRSDEVPSSFKAFEVRTGTATQTIIGYTYAPSGSIELTKAIGMPQVSADNSLYSPAGAKYGLFRDESCTDMAHELTTDESGYARIDNIATGRYWAKETAAPTNSQLNDKVYLIEVTDRQTTRIADSDASSAGKVVDQPAYATIDLLLSKFDAETGQDKPIGEGSFANAEFTMRYFPNLRGDTSEDAKFTWRFKTDASGQMRLASKEDAALTHIGGDGLPLDESGIPAFPVGTYTVQETKAPTGYLTSNNILSFTLTSDGQNDSCHIVQSGFTNVNLTVEEQAIRNDLKLVKKAENTNESLQVPFLLTSKATGEAHVLIADRNGNASTASNWNPHSRNTNGNDALIGAATISVADMDDAAGIWFGRDAAGNVAPVNDNLAALPYGEYLLEELRCDANEGFCLISKTIWVERDTSSSQIIWMSLSDQPATPETPDLPETPKTPDEPDTPTEPETPDTPSTPDKPEQPNTPTEPEQPSSSDEPKETTTQTETTTQPSENKATGESKSPATGDTLLAPAAIFFALAAALAIASAIYAKRASNRCRQHHKRSYLRYR